MGMSSGGGRAVPYINVTPLIDVLLVLLIIFMVITPLKPSRFEALVPREATEQQKQAAPNPNTLIVLITQDGKIRLNDKEDLGTVGTFEGGADNTAPLSTRLLAIFQERKTNRAYKPGIESDPNFGSMTEDQRIERTVFIKAPRTLRYEPVVKVIDAVKGAGASPVGLQIDDLQ